MVIAILTTQFALAGQPSIADGPVVGEGAQEITVLMTGIQPGSRFDAKMNGQELTLTDPGIGVHLGTFKSDPKRSAHLVISDVRGQEKREVYDGLVFLTDQYHESIAFRYEDATKRAFRIPAAPSANVELALNQDFNYLIAFGWGGLSLGYLGVMALFFRRRNAA